MSLCSRPSSWKMKRRPALGANYSQVGPLLPNARARAGGSERALSTCSRASGPAARLRASHLGVPWISPSGCPSTKRGEQSPDGSGGLRRAGRRNPGTGGPVATSFTYPASHPLLPPYLVLLSASVPTSHRL